MVHTTKETQWTQPFPTFDLCRSSSPNSPIFLPFRNFNNYRKRTILFFFFFIFKKKKKKNFALKIITIGAILVPSFPFVRTRFALLSRKFVQPTRLRIKSSRFRGARFKDLDSPAGKSRKGREVFKQKLLSHSTVHQRRLATRSADSGIFTLSLGESLEQSQPK